MPGVRVPPRIRESPKKASPIRASVPRSPGHPKAQTALCFDEKEKILALQKELKRQRSENAKQRELLVAAATKKEAELRWTQMMKSKDLVKKLASKKPSAKKATKAKKKIASKPKKAASKQQKAKKSKISVGRLDMEA